jgi:hypothetical protein
MEGRNRDGDKTAARVILQSLESYSTRYCSLRREHWLQRFVQPRAIFLGHRNKFDTHPSSRRNPSHNGTRSHFTELQIHQHLHHATERHRVLRKYKQSTQRDTLEIRDSPPRARLPSHPYATGWHDARIAPLLCHCHEDPPQRASFLQKQP